MALANGFPVLAMVPWVRSTEESWVLKLVLSELPPPLSSFFKLKPKNAPNLKVCLPWIHDTSSRKLYRSCLLLHGAIICRVCRLPPKLRFGMPTAWLFRSDGNKVGKSA